jgi:hypothetical protein
LKIPCSKLQGIFDRQGITRTYLKIGSASAICHARESGHPENSEKGWIPVYTGMTDGNLM